MSPIKMLKLGKFVDPKEPNPPSHPSDARVVFLRPLWFNCLDLS